MNLFLDLQKHFLENVYLQTSWEYQSQWLEFLSVAAYLAYDEICPDVKNASAVVKGKGLLPW